MANPKCAGSSFGRTGSKPKWKLAATVRRWSGCTGRGGSIPIARSSSAWLRPHGLCAAISGHHAAATPMACMRSIGWLDLVVYHGELFDRLELEAPALAGHSFGGVTRRRNCCGYAASWSADWF